MRCHGVWASPCGDGRCRAGLGNDVSVPVELAELSSLSSMLNEVTKRVTSLADRAAAAKDEDTATELYGVERALSGATRRLDRLVRDQQR